MTGKKQNTGTIWTDEDDAPGLTDDFFERADELVGQGVVRRGRPAGSGNKVSTTVRFDADVLEAFRAAGPGWQTRMNAVLRDWLKGHSQP